MKNQLNEFYNRLQSVSGKSINECSCNNMEEAKGKEKWIQKTDMKKGALHKALGIPEDENIPVGKLKSIKAQLSKRAEGDKKLSAKEMKLMKMVNMALTLGKMK